MPRYIDADDLENITVVTYEGRLKRIDAPTADVEEVKHGEWEEIIDEKEDLFFRQKFYCSACGKWNTYGKTAYCPECGAKMDGGAGA